MIKEKPKNIEVEMMEDQKKEINKEVDVNLPSPKKEEENEKNKEKRI